MKNSNELTLSASPPKLIEVNDNPVFVLSEKGHAYNERLITELPSELQYDILSFLTGIDAIKLSMAARSYRSIVDNILFWKRWYKQEFSYHFHPLELLEKYQKIDWKTEYRTATSNLPWPFPLNKSKSSEKNENHDLVTAIKSNNVKQVIALLESGANLEEEHLIEACKLNLSPFLLEVLIAAAKQQDSDPSKLSRVIHSACRHNNEMATAILICAGADVDFKTSVNGSNPPMRPLHVALKYGGLTLVQMLLDHSQAQVTAPPNYPLFRLVCDNKKFEELAFLPFIYKDFNKPISLEKDLQKNSHRNAIESYLREISPLNATSKLEWLIVNGMPLDSLVKCDQEHMPILYAVILCAINQYLFVRNQTENYPLKVLRKLLRYKIDLEQRDNQGYTPLHYAVKATARVNCLQLDVIMVLKKAGADLHTTNDEGQTLLHTFLRNYDDKRMVDEEKFQALLKILLQEIDIFIPDSHGVTPLDLAKRHFLALYVMISSNLVPIALQNQTHSNNVLHVFVNYNKMFKSKQSLNKKIALLVKRGININQVNRQGKTPLELAIKAEDKRAIWCLIANGAQISVDAIHIKDKFISCARCIQQIINLISNKNMLQTFFSIHNNVTAIIEEAHRYSSSLTSQLLMNHLWGTMLSSAQKERLINYIIPIVALFDISFLQALVLLVREGREVYIHQDKIAQLLRVLVDACGEDRKKYHELQRSTSELLQEYTKKSSIFSSNDN